MRTFVIVGHKATTSPNFSLEDIPGTSGRLDILCRAATAAFVISHGIRKDASVYLVLLGGEAPKTILLHGESLRHLNPDERTTAALLKKALALPATERWAMSTSGITVRLGGLPELLEDLKEADLVYLR
ncbi:MAG: tRNA (pseudouridine(54)-N(1))-methyltransferase TrmY, partial [Methanothrix sp.]|nr:tRNA (pseudouridine(54)-N(1))-methyltransferase TrmY [Methanothrix sp.]